MRNHSEIKVRRGANLPHWTRDGATYAVTFRLADSLPEAAIEELKRHAREIERKREIGASPLTLAEITRLSKAGSEAFQKLLDQGHGECWLQRDDVAGIVADALQHFDGQRYRLHAWCVMPNHVHAVVEPLGDHSLAETLHSWKSFTANQANKALGHTGGFWQRESYDHLIRDEADYNYQVGYVRENPRAAGLVDWRWVG
ncbi:MAG: transposase [Planctomycetes bacterium]|nr:transposase [Planctomycetota bacterium]